VGTLLHCTALYFTVLHCTVLYCTALHCTTLHCTALHFTSLYCTALHCTALHCTLLHCTVLHCTALHFTSLYCTALHCTALYFTVLYCTALHCTLLHCTALHCTALYLREDQYSFVIKSRSVLLRLRDVSDNSFRENQNTHFVFSNFFFENRSVYEKTWKNIVERGRPQMTTWRMRIACWIPKTTDTNTQVV